MWWTRERNITMDWEMEQDRLLTLDSEMDHFDTEPPEEVVARIVGRYVNFLGPRNQSESPLWRWPLWQLVQDIQRQAAVHANIIEQFKAGENVSDVRRLFYDELGLVSSDEIPNPRAAEAIAKAFKKVSHYGTTLVILIRDFGRDLIGEGELLEAPQYTLTLQAQLGFPAPSVTVGIQM
jgi:hypothetical protein